MDFDIQGIGAAIRAGRKSKGLTQSELAEAMHLSVTHIRNIEHGRRQPAMDTLVMIFRELGIQMDPFIYPEASEKKALISEINAKLTLCTMDELDFLRNALDGIINKANKRIPDIG